MGRLAYLGRSLASQLNRRRYRCRNCESDRSQLIERKYLITHLRRCECCKLMFRTPTDDPASSQAFYETKYAQGVTTRTPSDVELDSLKGISFRGSELDYSYYVSILSALGLQDGAKLFDFGCSWGYGSYQLTCAGFDVTAFEIASIRANFARRKLNVRLIDNMGFAASDPAQKTQFDCFFSAHVLEHTPAPSQIFGYAMSRLLQMEARRFGTHRLRGASFGVRYTLILLTICSSIYILPTHRAASRPLQRGVLRFRTYPN
jgi:2-polyprenyl-3-methyl-5-hydroxy-6-metoxy-1,4-benzoquinol methylase